MAITDKSPVTSDVDWASLKPVQDTSQEQIDWASLKSAEEVAPQMDPSPSGPDGVFSQDRVLGSWNKAIEMTKTNISQTKLIGGLMSPEEFEDLGKAGAFAYGELFRRPLAALTALSVDTPFAGGEKTVLESMADGFINPDKYPPERMTEALIDAGMGPVDAAALSTLGQFGYYLGMGNALGRIVVSGKTALLNRTLDNVAEVLKAKGVSPDTVTVRAPAEIAKDTNILDVTDVYLSSRGLRVARVNPVLENGVETGADLVLKQIGKVAPESDITAVSEVAKRTFTLGETYGDVVTDGSKPLEMNQAIEILKSIDPKKTSVGAVESLITPAEYILKKLGLDDVIGSPIRQALQDTRIQFGDKITKLIEIKEKNIDTLSSAKEQAAAKLKIWEYVDKGIPEGDSPEIRVAKVLKAENREMLDRLNETNRYAGLPEITGLKNYMYHMVLPEVISDLIAEGKISEGFKGIIRPGVSAELFLKTAQERKGIPEEYLVKDPFEVMKAMYAIDIKYANLRKALAQIEPFLEGVQSLTAKEEKWDVTSVQYLEDWINHAVKRKPNNWDLKAQVSLDWLVKTVLNKVPGVNIKDLSFDRLTGMLSAAAQTGALGLRVKVALRNLTQSTFDWVMFGTGPYLKGLNEYGSDAGIGILKQSRVWKSRMPIEAQDKNSLSELMKKGSFLYRLADMRNIGVGILTRYHYAKDVLNYGHDKALKFADTDVAATQWSYTREDLPSIYWSAIGRSLATFGSWWMNYFTRFLPEAISKTFTGKTADGRVVGAPERMAFVRLVVLIGTAEAVRRKSKQALGTALDFASAAAPMPFGQSPQTQFVTGAMKVSQGLIGHDDRKWSEGWRDISRSAQVFIPYWLAIKDFGELLSGKSSIIDYLFYTGNKKTKSKGEFIT